jgi:transcriptional regulator with XRE-family HTH domain
MRHQKEPRTAGGIRLRALREFCGKTQLDVELDANLGIGYLQRLELGKVHHPERDTLERILAVLDVSFIERREVMELFGYAVAISTPNDIELQWAIDLFQSEVQQVGIPVYLLDCSHRLLAWNSLVPKLFGAFKTKANNILMPKLIFDSVDGIASSILNAEIFFPAQVRILQYEKQRYGDKVWFSGFVDEMRQYDLFDHYWTKEDQIQVPMRPVAQLKLEIGHGLVHFRLIAEPFAQDPRFRVIHYMPADTDTIRQCLDWQS